MLQKLNYDTSTGKYWMELTEEELTYIAGFTALTRLGQNNPYCDAAYNLSVAISNVKGDDFTCDSINVAGLGFSIVDGSGIPLVALSAENIAIETGV